MATMGPLLRTVLNRMSEAPADLMVQEGLAVAAHVGGSQAGERLPLVLQLKHDRPREGEAWPEFKARMSEQLDPIVEVLGRQDAKPLYISGSLAASLRPADAARITEEDRFEFVELDPVVDFTLMDDAAIDVGLNAYRQQTGLRGSGIRVAVLDSGIDTAHPHLDVHASVSTCGEAVSIPGSHGTHCAGSIASRDLVFPGIAPDVTLLNVKVLRRNGTGAHTNIVDGIGAALDLEADVLSMSVGFNHLPTWSDRGHGWACADGRCPLCEAVDNAVSFGAVVIVAAGNEHNRAEALRAAGFGTSFDTEIACPGQARDAITVGAVSKRTFDTAAFSSRGPTAFASAKPDVSAPGVNIMSTVPVPRDAIGRLIPFPQRGDLFDRKSGTSMATPIVAGAVALLIQQRRQQGLSDDPASVRAALLANAIASLLLPPAEVGAGRLLLA